MKRTILCYGDSNTHGFDTATGGRFDAELRWTGRLQRLLGEEYRVCEEGLSGRTTIFDDPLTDGLSGLRLLLPILMTHEPVDLLIIMLGTNDTKERFGASAENIAAGMRRLVLRAKMHPELFRDSEPKILLLCPPPILPVYAERIFAGEMGRGCAEKSERLAALYRELAEETGCRFLDASEVPGVSMSKETCGMHLPAESHISLAEALAVVVREMV